MKKIAAVFVGILMLSVVARGAIYCFYDDVMRHVFWVNTDRAIGYGNQLILPATITDYQGNTVTTDAMVTYDTYWGNLTLMHYGNYCIFSDHWSPDYNYAKIVQTSGNPSQIHWAFDHVYPGPPSTISFDKMLSLCADQQNIQDILSPASGEKPGENDGMSTNLKVPNPAGSAPTVVLTSGFGDHYYLYDVYQIGDPNFLFFAFTMIARSDNRPADGLVIVQQGVQLISYYEYYPLFKVIIIIFESHWVNPYVMAGLYVPAINLDPYHLFAWAGHRAGDAGTYTTVY